VIEALRTSILEPRDHLHIKHECVLQPWRAREAFLRWTPIPSSSPPNRPGLLGRTPATKAHNNAGVHQPRRTPRTLQPPRSSSDGGCLPPHGAPGVRRDAALAAGHACHIRGQAPVVPVCGSRFSD